jgi:hypothetical protein
LFCFVFVVFLFVCFCFETRSNNAIVASYVDELNAAMQVLALRARQVDALYAYAASLNTDQVSITEFDVEFVCVLLLHSQ